MTGVIDTTHTTAVTHAADAALAVHVERTSSPEALRWVCHRPDLDETPVPPRGSALEQMIDRGIVSAVALRSGDLIVRFPQPVDSAGPDTVAGVHRAVVDALRYRGWSTPADSTAVSIRTRAALSR